MKYTKGERVRNPGAPEWGLGRVLEDSSDTEVVAFFEGCGQATIRLNYVQPVKVTGDDAASSLLDNLPDVCGQVKFRTVAESKREFLKKFPGGFDDPLLVRKERTPKEKMHDTALELLGARLMLDLLEKGAHDEICARARKVVAQDKFAMLATNEKIAFVDALKAPEHHKRFSVALFDLLYGQGEYGPRFERWAACLEEMGVAKWPVATYLQFLVHPDRHMLLKPETTKHAAQACAFEIVYRPELNALTYLSVQRFSEYLFKSIPDLEPRNMLDIQTFMWCIVPGSYTAIKLALPAARGK